MRVLHVITGLNDGGAEAVLHRLVAHDPTDTHHVVSLMDDGKYGPLLRDAGAKVTALHMPRGRITLKGLRNLLRVTRSSKADVVQTWLYHADLLGGLAGRFAGIPVIWGVHNTMLEPGRSSTGTIWVAKLCARLSKRVPTKIVACAHAGVRIHAAMGYDAKRMIVIPNGYELSRFAPNGTARARLRAEWGVQDDVPLLGMVARFDPYKDHANLIAALGKLHASGTNFHAVLVGTGIEGSNRELAAQITSADLSDNVRLLGQRADIPEVMNAMDMHVLSSSAEAFPNVLAEAMACGTPCLTTNVGDAYHIVGNTGWVVPPRDADALSHGISSALLAWRNRTDWTERQLCARQRISDYFSVGRMVDSYRSVWLSALKS